MKTITMPIYIVIFFFITAIFFLADNGNAYADDINDSQKAPILLLPRNDLNNGKDIFFDTTSKATRNSASPINTKNKGIISVENLQQIDNQIFGILDKNNGGFDFEIWHGTDNNNISRNNIKHLLSSLPDNINSPILRKLIRRLLLSTVNLPRNDQDINIPRNIGELRINQLLKMNLFQDAAALINMAKKAGNNTDELQKKLVTSYLYLNSYDKACAQIPLANDKLNQPYWQKLLIFCQALSGDKAGAEFGTTLLLDMGEEDQVFFNLIDKLINGTEIKLSAMPNPTALSFALAKLTKTPLPDDILNHDQSDNLINIRHIIMRVIAMNDANDIDIRLKYAEKAAKNGAITIDELIDIYKSIKFSKKELNNPMSMSENNNSPKIRALLYQASAKENIIEAKVLIIEKALDLAKQAELYPLIIAVYSEEILKIPANLDIGWFASDATRALYAIGRPLPAQAWLKHLQKMAVSDIEARKALINFWPLVNISAKSLLHNRQIFDGTRKSWVESKFKNMDDNNQAVDHITKSYILLESLGITIADEAWLDMALIAKSRYIVTPNQSISHMLLSAAKNGKKAEVIIWIIKMLGETGIAHAPVNTTAAAISALNILGMTIEARAIAIEAAIAYGL